MFMCAKFVSAVNECDLLSDWLQHESPVDCRITATADQHFSATELIEITDEIVQIRFLKMSCIFQL
ncbi:hypothetical protein D3C76_1597420 [compost metagenome]